MSTVATLSVSVKANIEKFAKKMKRATKIIKKFSASVAKSAKSVAKLGIAAGLAAATGIALLINRQRKLIDMTAKLSDELGISVKDMKGLEFAAGITGTTLQNLVRGTQRLIRRLGEAELGYGEGVKGLKAMGLSAEGLAKRLPIDALKDVAQAISILPNASQRAGAAFTLFGRQGQELMSFLLLGRKGITALIDENEKLQGSLTRLDFAKVELMNDAIERLERTFSGLVTKLTIKFAPLIDAIAKKIVKFTTEGSRGARTMDTVFSKLAPTMIKIVNLFDRIRAAILDITATATFFSGIFASSEDQESFGRAAIEMSNQADALRAAISRGDTGKALEATLKRIEAASDKAAAAVKKLSAERNKLRGGLTPAARAAAQKITNKLMEEGLSIIKALRNPQEVLADTRRKLNLLLKIGAIEQRHLNMALKDAVKLSLKDPFGRMAAKARRLQKNMKALQEVTDRAREALDTIREKAKDIFEDTRTPIERIKREMQELRDIFNTFGSDLKKDTFDRKMKQLQDALKKATQDPLTEFAKGIIEETKTPIEKFRQKMNKVAESFRKNLITEEVFRRFKDAAKKALDSSKKKPGAVGTAREINLSRISVGGIGRSRTDVQKVSDPANKITNQILGRIERKFGRGATPAVAQ